MSVNDTPPNRAAVIPVSLFVSSARLLVERHLGLTWVSGEVSNCSLAASGHVYFVLKDEDAQVRCVLYRSKAQLLDLPLKDGLRVEVRAVPTIYEARGEFQLTVDMVRLSGLGALYEQFARRRARLEAAGWFAPARKRPLPNFPRAIGVVTSLRAAALADVLTTLERRMPALPVIVYPASVQGAGAASEIASAIAAANAHARVDVLIVCRGGGSIEDLWAFNEEAVARAIFESRIPIVSGVGHETDFTICDFVADARGATPTGAAALASPDGAALNAKLAQLGAHSRRAAQHILERCMQRFDRASRRLVHPAARLASQRERLDLLRGRLARIQRVCLAQREWELAVADQRFIRMLRAPPPQRAALERTHARWQLGAEKRLGMLTQRIASLRLALKHLGPQAVLDRGYSIVMTESGAVVQDASQVAPGDGVAMQFARGAADATVTRTRSE
jgi:exodeoxyribonuclease VII large subunit